MFILMKLSGVISFRLVKHHDFHLDKHSATLQSRKGPEISVSLPAMWEI